MKSGAATDSFLELATWPIAASRSSVDSMTNMLDVHCNRRSPPAALGAATVLSALPATLLLAGGVATATAPGDNGQIVFRRYLGPDRTKGANFTIAPDGTGERQLTTPAAKASDDFPDYAPDGNLVAFQRCAQTRRIHTVRPDATGITSVGAGCSRAQEPPKCTDNTYPAISPDSTQIAFVRRTDHGGQPCPALSSPF